MSATGRFTINADDSYSKAVASTSRGLVFTRNWLTFVALLVLVMVTIGGATRLTGSGLSITEWKPISGVIPPLGPEAWVAEFERYKLIPQYKLQNTGISLDEFKTLFWWEWSHRQLGRFIGLVYALGFVAGLALGYIRGRLAVVLFGLGLLLGLQGLVGWIMVHSGLQEGMVAVAPVKLALHLVLACTFFASIIAVRGSLRAKPAAAAYGPGRLRITAVVLLALVFVQIALGALVAGNKAGLVYNTWPLMDGAIVPPAASLFFESPWWLNLLDNHLTVQFNHRISAYLLLAVALWHAFDVRQSVAKSALSRSSHSLAGLVLLQAVLGIVTLVLAVPLWAGLMHQALAVLVLGVAVWNLQTTQMVNAIR